MVDLTQLPPAEMARHLGRPDGEVELAVTERLNRVNANITAEAYRRLEPGAGMHVIEIGFGNGHLLPDLLRLAPNLLYSGIDISPTMVDEARRFNAALVNSVGLHSTSPTPRGFPPPTRASTGSSRST